MAGIFNASIFNNAVFNTGVVATQEAGGGKPWKQKWRQELVELLAEPVPEIVVPAKAKKAIQRVLDKAPPDDVQAIRTLRGELDRLRVPYKPQYVQALRIEARKQYQDEDDDEVMFLLLH